MATHLPCGIELPQVFFDGPTDMEHMRNSPYKRRRWVMIAVAARADHRRLHHAGAGDTAELRGRDHDPSEVGHLGDSPAAAQSDSIGESLLMFGRDERRPGGDGRRSWGRALGSDESVFGYTREGRVTALRKRYKS